MEYSWRYESTLRRVFLGNGDSFVGDITNLETTLDKHNVFNRMFVIDVSSDEIEIPVFARSAVEEVVKGNLEYPHIRQANKVVIPMYVNTPDQSRRTADSIVTDFFSRVNFSGRLQRVTTTKGEVYYGSKGIILDKDLNILFLCTIVCRKMEYDGRQIMSYYKSMIHISPQIFLRGEGLIHKSILKKIIPFYVSHDIDSVGNHAFFSDNLRGTKPQILIDDVSRFIEKPIKPTPQRYSNDVLNQLLVDNIDDVLSQFEDDT